MSDEGTYYNFPIQLIKGFLDNDKRCLNNILDYHLYKHSLKLECGSEIENFEDAAAYYEINLVNSNECFKNAVHLINSIPAKSPRVSIASSVFWNFYQNYKSEFEKVCLLSYLAFKSILGDKPYCKVDNNYFLARLNGNVNTIENTSELEESIQKYANHYQIRKIKNELSFNWGLKTYSRQTRGFYISFKLSLEELIFQAEKNRKSYKEKMLKKSEADAVKKALEKLYKPP